MNNYQNILETLKNIKNKKKSSKYLELLNIICNLLNEEEIQRFNSAAYLREFKFDRLNVLVRYQVNR